MSLLQSNSVSKALLEVIKSCPLTTMEWGLFNPVKLLSNGHPSVKFDYDCYEQQGSVVVEYNQENQFITCYYFDNKNTPVGTQDNVTVNNLIERIDDFIRLNGQDEADFLQQKLSG